ncbi:pseudaminic acid cytidylyltransferase [Candidatus Dependentiae bacterium]|nr:pseudaminic acid cytidylyltransferase [Candidatus Dependentiae bacterium]
MNCLAIIPARGGSKRIPRKNIKEFCGQPIIKYSIDVAIESCCFNEIMVSTDDIEIAKIAKKYGAQVPFFRSKINSNDFATLADVIKEVLDSYKKIQKQYDYVCCILATAPFVNKKRIIDGFDILKECKADSLVSVIKFNYPIQRALKIDDSKLQMFWPENYNVRSQDLVSAYHDAGQFYWINSKSYLEQKRIFADYTIPLIIPNNEVQDIDTEDDWIIAEFKYNFLKNVNKGKGELCSNL